MEKIKNLILLHTLTQKISTKTDLNVYNKNNKTYRKKKMWNIFLPLGRLMFLTQEEGCP